MLGPRPLDDALSERMSRVRRRDTGPELELRRELRRRGLRYRVGRAPIAGLRSRPDVVFGPARVAVYVDGCFWHGCPLHGVLPKNNRSWSHDKLDANRRRDARANALLTRAEWLVIRIWEHEDLQAAAARIETTVDERTHGR